jgi:hypothetical protein
VWAKKLGRIESELEMRTQNLREDAVQIRQKINQTKAELNPTNLVSKRSYFVLGAALSAGVAAGYFLDWRKIEAKQVASPVLQHIAKPAARIIVIAAGRQLVTMLFRKKMLAGTERQNPSQQKPNWLEVLRLLPKVVDLMRAWKRPWPFVRATQSLVVPELKRDANAEGNREAGCEEMGELLRLDDIARARRMLIEALSMAQQNAGGGW